MVLQVVLDPPQLLQEQVDVDHVGKDEQPGHRREQFLDALTMFPRFTELQGSLANSLAAALITSPAPRTSSTAPNI